MLPSGLRLLVEPTEWLQGVTAGLYVAVGSADEPPGLHGIAHVLEHVVFKGTANYSGQEIGSAIEAFGGEVNAYTTKEYTCLWGRALPEGSEKLLELLGELFSAPLLKRHDLNLERRVIQEEYVAWLDNPEDQVCDLLEEEVFRGDHLERTVLGRPATLENVRNEDLRRFHQRHWRLGRAVLAVCGPVDAEAVRLLAERFFTPPQPTVEAAAVRSPRVPAPADRPPMRLGQTHVAIGGLALPYGAPMLAAQDLLMEELGGGPNSRLFQRLREREALSYGVYSFQTAYRRRGMWGVYADISHGKLREGIQAILGEIRLMQAARYARTHLQRLVASVRGQFLLSLDAPFARLERAAVSSLLLGQVEPPDQAAERIQRVQSAELRTLAREIFAPEAMRIAMIDSAGGIRSGELQSLLDDGGLLREAQQ